jgi:hypothetical protein
METEVDQAFERLFVTQGLWIQLAEPTLHLN